MNTVNMIRPPLRTQRGTTLLEALVAFLVLSLGMLSAARVQTELRLNADVARQRSEAVRLAQEELESMRAFAVLAIAPGTPAVRSYDAITNGTRQVDTAAGYASNTSYLVTRQVDAASLPQAKSASVSVSWTDRNGGAQQVALNSVIAGDDPAYSGALGLVRSGVGAKGPLGRAVTIPLDAKDLGNGSSVFKPASNAGIAFVFNNISGQITARCTGIAASTATRELTLADLGSCDSRNGLLLSGQVRFSSTSPPDAGQGNETPLPAAISLALVGGGYPSAPECATEAMKTVSYTQAGSLHIDAVPLAASAASMGLPGWAETGERHLSYHCAVYPPTSGQWSGRATLAPAGWIIGNGSTERRVCRYSGDADGSGAVDANIEHPASYAGVSTALPRQNFLVIKGTESCPIGRAVQVAGTNADVYVGLATVQHQP